jgi:hypothetical protein
LSKPESGLALNNVDTHKKDVDVKHSRCPSAEICSRGEIVLQNVSFAGLVLRQAVSGLPLATTRQGNVVLPLVDFIKSFSSRYYLCMGPVLVIDLLIKSPKVTNKNGLKQSPYLFHIYVP